MPVGKPLYALGDLVKSKVGSVKMVVDEISLNEFAMKLKEPDYLCIWWIGSKRCRESFTESGLEPWVEPEKDK